VIIIKCLVMMKWSSDWWERLRNIFLSFLLLRFSSFDKNDENDNTIVNEDCCSTHPPNTSSTRGLVPLSIIHYIHYPLSIIHYPLSIIHYPCTCRILVSTIDLPTWLFAGCSWFWNNRNNKRLTKRVVWPLSYFRIIASNEFLWYPKLIEITKIISFALLLAPTTTRTTVCLTDPPW
jgi:hypothetical protein